MELRNLLSFIQVAELSSFTKAAEITGYSQSNISFQIKQLENELGCLLFERINHTVSLTDKGEELLRYANSVTQLTDEFMQSISCDGEPTGLIHLVAPDSVCEDMLLNNYRSFHKCYPKIDLKFTNADTSVMFAMLDRNEADAVITLDTHNYQNDYIIAKEEPVAMCFTASAASPFAGAKDISIRDIISSPFILTEKSMGYRRALDVALAEKSIAIAPALEIGRTDVIIKLLEETDAISCLPEFIVKEKVKAGTLVTLDVADIRLDIWKQLIYHKNKWISNCMRAFLEFVKENEFSA